jgi:hypothetical protein
MPEVPEGNGTVKIVESARGSGLRLMEAQNLECELAYE